MQVELLQKQHDLQIDEFCAHKQSDCAIRGWQLLLLWPAVSFGIVAIGYLHLGPIVYGKSQRGLLSPICQLLLLLYLWAIWYTLRLLKREPAFNQLTDNVFIGRRVLSHELPDDINHVIDLTCEFNEPKALRSTSYHSFQILDGFVPSTHHPPSNNGQRAVRLSGASSLHLSVRLKSPLAFSHALTVPVARPTSSIAVPMRSSRSNHARTV